MTQAGSPISLTLAGPPAVIARLPEETIWRALEASAISRTDWRRVEHRWEASAQAPWLPFAEEFTPRLCVDQRVLVARHDGADIALALRLGTLGGGEAAQRAPVSEIQLKTCAGERRAAFALARLFVDAHGLWVEGRGLEERARRAIVGRSFHIERERRAKPAEQTPVYDALAASLRLSARRIASLRGAIVDMRQEEGVHRLRVALRRFRAVERVYRPLLGRGDLYALTRRARMLAKRLGPARDADVFLAQTLPELLRLSGGDARLRALARDADARRAAAWADAHQGVAEKSFTHFALDLYEAAFAQSWRRAANQDTERTITDYAPLALDRSWRKLQRVKETLPPGDMAALHQLRLAVKKHRYAAQIFARVFDREARKPYMAAMSELQDALGAVNDAVVAAAFADAVRTAVAERERRPAGRLATARAAGFIAGAKAVEAETAAATVDAAYHRLAGVTPFWRAV